MTSAHSVYDAPWVPGMDREQRTVPVPLPEGLPAGLRALLVLEEPTSVPAAVAVRDPADGTLRVRVSEPAGGRVSVLVFVPAVDATALWLPGSDRRQSGLPPSWADDLAFSPFAGAPLGSLIGRNDRPVVTFGARTRGGRLRMRAGMVEETAELLLDFAVDLSEGELEVVLDLAPEDFGTAVGRVREAVGLRRPAVAAENLQPVLCTWYSFHQALDQDRLLAQARTAASMGFGTVIIDDGWQTADNDRGYGSCGDWQVEPSKIPDGAALVSELAGLGLRTMFWVAAPFLGYRSAAYAEHELPALYDEPAMEAAVLDPRSRRVREHLVERLTALLRDTGAAGFKIDFLERFAVDDPAASPEDSSGESVLRAALGLLDELHASVSAVRPEPMIEFREPFWSPETLRRTTMMRVGDCPLSPVRNRVGIVDLRLATAGVAVHSDPIMWAAGDTPERVAQHLHSSLFGVPQVSIALDGQSPEQLATLRTWMRFWTEHRDVLLGGRLRVVGIASDYAAVETAGDDVVITAQYAPVISDAPAHASTWIVVNAHEQEVLLRSATPRTARYSIVDCMGTLVDEGDRVLEGVTALAVPAGGMLRATFEKR